MLSPVKCRCGKRFRPKAELAGKVVACPSCKQPLTIPAPGRPRRRDSDERHIAVCQCGKRFAAPSKLAGRQVRCPSCRSVLRVPSQPVITAAEPAPLDDLLGSGPLDIPAALNPDPLYGPPGLQAPYAEDPATTRMLLWAVGVVGAGALFMILMMVAWSALMTGSSTSDSDATVAQSSPSAAGSSTFQPAESGTTTDSSLAPSSAESSPAHQSSDHVALRPESEPIGVTGSVASGGQRFGDQHGANGGNAAALGQVLGGSTKSRRRSGSRLDLLSNTQPLLTDGMQQWWQGGARKGRRSVEGEQQLLLHYSWMTDMLPFLGYEDVYHKIQFNKPWTDDANVEIAATVIPQFLNPVNDRKTWKGLPYEGLALTHFVGMSGVEDRRNVVAATLPRSDPRAGVFGYDDVASPAQITDGTSQTIMIIGSGNLASPWIQAGGGTIRGAREPYFDPLTGFGSQGLLSGGAVVVMADGSVREVSADIDPAIFRAMCTIHGADSVDLD